VRRALSLFLNFCLLGGGWAGIIFSKFFFNAYLPCSARGAITAHFLLGASAFPPARHALCGHCGNRAAAPPRRC